MPLRNLSASAGSSPLTRGKRPDSPVLATRGRLIPAHAGKTTDHAWRCAGSWAHPRSRGENVDRVIAFHGAEGSSPLTRGKLATHPCVSRSSPAHPRSRGENRLVHWPTRAVMGSSPLTRGKLPRYVLVISDVRLIPAHAGKTPPNQPAHRPGGAHPRSRGENTMVRTEASAEFGSSPLTRGKRCGAVSRRLCRRLIPAHAGKTRHTWVHSQSRPAHPRSRGENRI